MKINTIMAKSQNLTTKKINFGKIENKQTEELTHNLMMKEIDWYSEEDKKDPDFGYKETVEYIKEKLDYFKASRLFTLKTTKNTRNNDVLYVVMHKDETDKHEHKELFDEMIQEDKDIYNSVFHALDAQRAGLPGDEKEFLRILSTDSDIDDFYREMQLREHGERPEPPKPTSTNTTPSSDEKYDPLADDKSYQAWKLYGV